MIPGGDLDLMRSSPQMSDVYMIIQQPELYTDDIYASPFWDKYQWSCRVNGSPTGDPVVQLTVDAGSSDAFLNDGQTIFISGSEYGEWDKAIVRVRGDQTVTPVTTTLNIAASSDIAGRVKDGDYVVVLDEFRLWQRYGRIEAAAGVVTWYKDYNILWDNTGLTDAGRRLASMPPVPIMGPHAVKFVDTPNTGASFWFDWSNSYDLAVGEAIDVWNSWGVVDHAYNVWNSAAQVPGWKAVNAISGLKGFRVWLEVNDGNGNDVTKPFRRGVRYVFTVRRPGDTQAGDPSNAEAIKDFRLGSDISGNFNTGYWSTTVTLYGEAASRYKVIPGALVILFADDYYQQDSPYLSPSGIVNTSVGPVRDRENILFVGRIADGSIVYDETLEEVTFAIQSVAEEASQYDNYPIVIEDDPNAEDWIDTPSLTVDRAIRHYVAWHTTLSLIADVYATGDDHSILAQDFMGGPIYSTIDSFLRDRLFARFLCDKYGTLRSEIDVQMLPYGSVETLWNLEDCDWLDSLAIKRYEKSKANAVEAGGIMYVLGTITPKLSRAPGVYDKYRGSVQTSNALAITDQDELNVLSGRFLEALNYEWDVAMSLAGNWRWLDISPQASVNIQNLSTQRGILNGRCIIREVRYSHDSSAGAIFTSIKVESESGDGIPGITVDVPEELPDVPLPDWGLPTYPVIPTDPVSDLGRRIFTTDVGVMICDNIGATSPIYTLVNSGFVTADDRRAYGMRRDPFHSWNEASYVNRRLYVCTSTGVWVNVGFPHGTWYNLITLPAISAATGDAYVSGNVIGSAYIDMSIEVEGLSVFVFNSWIDARTWAIVFDESGTIISTSPMLASSSGWPDVAFADHSGGNKIYVAASRDPFNLFNQRRRLWRTLNRGALWTLLIEDGFMPFARYNNVTVPYVDASNTNDIYVLHGVGEGHTGTVTIGHYYSDDQAATNTGYAPYSYVKTGTGGGNPNNRWQLAGRPFHVPCRWTNDGGVTWNNLPLFPYDLNCTASYVIWNGNVLSSAIVAGTNTGTYYWPNSRVMYWQSGWGAWVNKDGNIGASGVRAIRAIDRESSGAP